MALVELKNLTVRFGSVTAVENLSLRVERGDRLGIIGESGSGKSMTALAIAGLLPENAVVTGQVLFDGLPLPSDEQAMARLRGKRIGMVFQEPMTALNPLMTVGKQIEEAIELAGVRGSVPELLEEVGLIAAHAERFPHELSGGQRQRAMIAMALASQPELLIADEPTSALDAITQRKVLDLLGEICARRQTTLIFISHDIRAVASLCDTVAVMRSGELVESGPRTSVLQSPQADYTRALLDASGIERRVSPKAPGSKVLLEVRKLTRDYGTGGLWPWRRPGLRAVNNVSFSLKQGESVALVGPSGCGKTTLARMVVGLDSASEGEMLFDGRVYRGKDLPPPLRASVSLVFQDPFGSFDPRMTVGQSLREPLGLLGAIGTVEKDRRVADAITSVGLPAAMLERYPHEFSGGQRQRLAIARAMVTRPRLLVLDEPISALDVSVRGAVLDLLAKLRAEHGLTYLIISHDLDMVAAMADRVMVMEAGKIVETGRPDDIFARPQHEMTHALIAARLPDVLQAPRPSS